VPSGAVSSELYAVECVTSTFCIAVGFYTDGSAPGVYLAFSAVWNGSTWSLKPVVDPVGATHSALQALDCTKTTACTAVGGWTGISGQATLVERWDGTSWAIQTSPNDPNSAGSVLQEVHCSSATYCTAVGKWITKSGPPQKTLAMQWNGTTCSRQTPPNGSGATDSRQAAVDACTA